jgi:hypothetical protein
MVIMDQTPWQKEWLLEGGIMQYLGGIEVQNERGKALGAFVETGPIAHNTQVLPLGELDGPLQLELTEGLWRVDHIKLVELLEPVEARVHEVVALEKNGEPAGKDLERLQNVEEHLMSLPGENWTLHFELLDVPSHVFLESEGYYHEWTRTTWNDPGAPRALNHMILHPRQFLRDEAAAYKVYEDTMEPLFWQSKIQTPILSNHEN